MTDIVERMRKIADGLGRYGVLGVRSSLLGAAACIEALQAENDKLRAERARLFDGNAFMADGDIEMSAAEDVLAWLLIERLGCVDDRGYTPNEAQDIVSAAIKQRDDAEAEVARLTAALADEQATRLNFARMLAAEESRSGRLAERADGAIRGLQRLKTDFKMRGANATTVERAVALIATLKGSTDDAQA